jgi:L-lysine 6-transaminase
MYFPKFADWPRIDPPACIFPLEGENLQKVIAAEQRAVSEITDILEKDADGVAAIILETIMGEGGDNQFRPEFLRELRRLADKYSVFLIFDEVQCGMGLTGKMWAWQNFGVVPDAVCFGKKSQVCGFMCTARVDEVPDNVFKVCSRINSTWGGNLTDMVRAQRVLEIIEEDGLVANVERVGKYFLDKLRDVQAKYPKLVSNSRGIGFMCAFDLPNAELRNKFRQLCHDKLMVVLPCGTHSIRFRPSLITTQQDVDICMKITHEVFDEMSK